MIKKTLHNSINDFYETSLNYSCCFLFSFYLLWKILGKNNITKVFSYFVSFQSNAGHSIIIVILLLLHVYQTAWSYIYENLQNFNSIILSMHKIRVCIENISRTHRSFWRDYKNKDSFTNNYILSMFGIKIYR